MLIFRLNVGCKNFSVDSHFCLSIDNILFSFLLSFFKKSVLGKCCTIFVNNLVLDEFLSKFTVSPNTFKLNAIFQCEYSFTMLCVFLKLS